MTGWWVLVIANSWLVGFGGEMLVGFYKKSESVGGSLQGFCSLVLEFPLSRTNN